MSSKTMLVLLAPGAEEIEATAVIDVLRRAEVHVTVAGLEGAGAVTCSRGVRLLPDVALSDVQELFDAIVLPGGGPGSKALAASAEVGARLRAHWEGERVVAAICAAPIALLSHGVGLGKRITHYPGASAELSKHFTVTNERVCNDGNLITGIGPGASLEFALALVERLCGDQVRASVAAGLLLA
ncbi:MAG TPA: DJ-1 family glyoxalase III [Polyangiaceae bacterium]|jgi:DJ-1 family protein|nr:DJ-1 family glyoxalase III [Polyangiaceae bacterium]